MIDFKCFMEINFLRIKKSIKNKNFKISKTLKKNFSMLKYTCQDKNEKNTKLNNLINIKKYKDIKYGIKLCNKNIGFNGKFYTFLYFLTFLLKRFLKEK